jgi:hypothetical protein
MLTLRRPEDRTPRSTHCCMHRLPNKKTKSTLARLASLPHTTLDYALACGARLHASPTRCGARLPSPGFSAWLPVSRDARLLALQARCEAAASLPCRTATAEPLPRSTTRPLPPANSTCRRASILQAARRCLH